MSEIKYKKAPVSEVILGITFKNPVLGRDASGKLLQKLLAEFPVVEAMQPLADDSFTHNVVPFPTINTVVTGNSLIRLWSHDKTWLVQFQFNKIFFNWVRQDHKDVGHYPGYTPIYKKFLDIVNFVFTENKLSDDDVLYKELVYHDRANINSEEFQNFEKLVNYTYPRFRSIKAVTSDFVMSSRSRIDELGGFLVFNVSAIPNGANNYILIVQSTTKGALPGTGFDKWFDLAHNVQVNVFEDFISKETLNSWK